MSPTTKIEFNRPSPVIEVTVKLVMCLVQHFPKYIMNPRTRNEEGISLVALSPRAFHVRKSETGLQLDTQLNI